MTDLHQDKAETQTQWGPEEIENAVKLLYHHPDAHSTANSFLTKAQNSRSAWQWVWHLLEVSHSKSLEVEYFAACTIHQKITRHWHEVSDSDVTDSDNDGSSSTRALLRQRLVQCLLSHIAATQDGNPRKIVITKLCAATAALLIQMTGMKEWPTAVEDLIAALQPASFGAARIAPERIAHSLVELLAMMPEELHSCVVSPDVKRIIRHELTYKIHQVFTVIDQVLSSCHNISSTVSGGISLEQVPPSFILVQQMALKCFVNWTTQMEGLVLEAGGYNWHDQLLNYIFLMLLNDQLIGNAGEALVLIYAHPEMHKHPQTVKRLIGRVASLDKYLDSALSADPRQEDVIMGIYTLITQIGEHHSKVILDCIMKPGNTQDSNTREACLKIITMILQCSSAAGHFPVDEDYSCLSFNFWYSLHDDIVSELESLSSPPVADPDSIQPDATCYKNTFLPLFSSLVDALLVKLQFPAWHIYLNEWSSEEKETFRCYRQDIGDTINYCYSFLKPVLIRNLVTHFHLSSKKLIEGQVGVTDVKLRDESWQALEAVLFTFSVISDNLDPSWLDLGHPPIGSKEDEMSIMTLFQKLPSLPLAVTTSSGPCPRLLATSMELVGSYCDLMADMPALLPSTIQLLLLGLQSNSHLVTLNATMALKDLSRECQSNMKPYAEQLLIACRSLIQTESQQSGSASSESEEHPAMTNKEKIRLMSSVGYLLSILPIESIMLYLNDLLPPFLSRLQAILDSPVLVVGTPQEKEELRKETLLYVNMLCMLFGSLDTNNKIEEGTEAVNSSSLAVDLNPHSDTKPQPVMVIMQQVTSEHTSSMSN